ncbi:hypothetical protein CBR_g48716 [Chara braunii]|uniref:Uncharacterized protein n=1 Tax=Chara braunii TaxID=69332 RepID=A0A388K4J7_CHABU|nr:hypothetical protein CBR_g48716 [Chara braunii]|eukprot:GBG64967.1 hypothetical protein CBR_g48716 [Chara braunii]
MVISEAVLAVTAYVLGLRRSYRLVRRLEGRLLRSHPRTRNFVERRTRALFKFAASVAEKVRQKDSALGRKLGNALSRWSRRQRELHHDSQGRVVRGNGSKLDSCCPSSTSTSTSTQTSMTSGIKNGKSTRSSDRPAGSKFGPGTRRGQEGKKVGFCTLIPSAQVAGREDFRTVLQTSRSEAGHSEENFVETTTSIGCVDDEEETSVAGPSGAIGCVGSDLPPLSMSQLTRLLSTVLSALSLRARCRMQQPHFFLFTTPITEDVSSVLSSRVSCSSSSSQVLSSSSSSSSPSSLSARPSLCSYLSGCSEFPSFSSSLSTPSLRRYHSFSSAVTFLASHLLDKRAYPGSEGVVGEKGTSSLGGQPDHLPSLDSMFLHGALNDPIQQIIPSRGSRENLPFRVMRKTEAWNEFKATACPCADRRTRSCGCDVVTKGSNAMSAGQGRQSSERDIVGTKRPTMPSTPQLIRTSHLSDPWHQRDVVSFFSLMSRKGGRQDLLSLPWRPPSLARSFRCQPCFVSPSLRLTLASSCRRLQS